MYSQSGSTYRDHLNRVGSLSRDVASDTLASLLKGCPSKSWPDGMPCSLDPKLVVIGVSPGNSPESGVGSRRYVSEPATFVGAASHFYYPDTSRYWEKVRYLASAVVSRQDKTITEKDALLITSHFNLGTGSAGTACEDTVEPPYVEWVSSLLNGVLRPDLVVLFGLHSILTKKKMSECWNVQTGLRIDWKNPQNSFPFNTPRGTYQYRQWRVSSDLGHILRVVMWPNHPSRWPVARMDSWKHSVDHYIETCEDALA